MGCKCPIPVGSLCSNSLWRLRAFQPASWSPDSSGTLINEGRVKHLYSFTKKKWIHPWNVMTKFLLHYYSGSFWLFGMALLLILDSALMENILCLMVPRFMPYIKRAGADSRLHYNSFALSGKEGGFVSRYIRCSLLQEDPSMRILNSGGKEDRSERYYFLPKNEVS